MLSKKITPILVLIFSGSIFAQNTIDYSLYNYSPNLVNPAFAGKKSRTELLIDSKMQWIGVKDAPRTNTFSLNMPLKENLGLGINVISDKIFVFSQTQISLDLSYKVKMDETHDFSFGFKAIGNVYTGNINSLKIGDNSDEFFAESIDRFQPNFTFGGAVIHKYYFVHTAIQNLLKDRRYENLENSDNVNRFNIALGGGYNYAINDNIIFKPSTLIRIIEGSPLEFDVNSTFEFNKKYNASLSYFWNNSFQLSGLAEFTKWFGLGYGYRLYVNDISSHQSGTHEFILKLNMDKLF